jgi:ADP-ribose pyrophosphatase
MKIKRPKSNQPIPKNAQRVFKGIIFDTYQWPQKMFDGSVDIFEKLKRPDIVNVLPIINQKTILTQQEQPATKPFTGSAGGRVDRGESPLQAAKRELLEETGYQAKKWILWEASQFFSQIDCAVYTFIAKDCQKIAKLKLDSGEKIKLKAYSFNQFLKVVFQENFRDLEITLKIARIKQSPQKLKQMKKLFLSP